MPPEFAHFSLSEINKQSRAGIPITAEERAYRTWYHTRYARDKADFRPGWELLGEWRPLWEGRGMSQSEWMTERIQVSLRPESPEVADQREQIKKLLDEREMLHSQLAELASERARDKAAFRDHERELNAMLADAIRARGGR